MGYLVLVLFLLRIEVTRQFRHISWDQQQRTSNDYIRCTTETIARLRSDNVENLRFYIGDESDSRTALIIRSIFDMKPPIPLVISKYQKSNKKSIVNENNCIAVVSDASFLRKVLKMLYRMVHHEKCVICVTYHCDDPIGNLSSISEEIWTSGMPRNVIFIVTNSESQDVRIIGEPAYSMGNCLRTKLIEVGKYRKGNFSVHGTGLYPQLNDLGGCEMSVMVQPPILPYIERMEDSPGGIVGNIINLIEKSMNFTAKYVWSVTYNDMINHIYSSDLNLMIDMTPHSGIPDTDYRFSVGLVRVCFIVPRKNRKKMWNRLISPYNVSISLAVAITFGFLVLFSWFTPGSDSSNIILKTFGTLLGVGVGRITRLGSWMITFFWCWLLPSYVLSQWYLASLTGDIAIPIFEQEIRTFEDLVTSKLDLMCSSGTHGGICKLKNRFFQMLCAKCRVATDEEIWSVFYPNLIKTGLMNDTSILSNVEIIEAHPAFTNVYALDHSTQVSQLALVRPGSTWIFEMQEIWERIFASGLVHHWKRRYIDTIRRKTASKSIGSFRPQFSWYTFLVLIVGWIISFGCFVVELILHQF